MSNDRRWLAYAALSAGLRRALPPFVDGPFVRAVRGAMIDRVAKENGVTLTAEARKLFVEIEDPLSAKGRVEKGARWLLGRVIPGLGAVDTTLHLVTTFSAGALLMRYFAARPRGDTGAVVDGFEATRVRRALKVALDFATAEHARGVGSVVGVTAGAVVNGSRAADPDATGARALALRAVSAVDAGLTAVPDAWLDVLEPIFRREFDR